MHTDADKVTLPKEAEAPKRWRVALNILWLLLCGVVLVFSVHDLFVRGFPTDFSTLRNSIRILLALSWGYRCVQVLRNYQKLRQGTPGAQEVNL